MAMAEQFNAAHYLVDRHVEAGDGERVAVRGSRNTLTYAELAAACADVAGALRGLGLRRDDRVVLVMSDDAEMVTGILGAFRAGVVAVPVSTMYNGAELGTILADSGARVVLTTHEYAAAVSQALQAAPDVEHVVLHGAADLPVPAGTRLLTWDEFVTGGRGEAARRELAPTVEDAWALWLYTSGTTGSPKGAMHRQANIRHVSETYGQQVLGIRPDDACFSIAKLFFAYGIGNSLFFPLSAGASTILEPRRPVPAVVAERVRAERPTLFFGVPTFFASLLASDIPDDTFASVRLGTSAGESLPAPLQKRFTDRFGFEILDGIGSTEVLHIFVSNRPDDIRPGTTGRAVPGYDIELRDADGNLVPVGEPGGLFVRGQSSAVGYWRRTDASRQVFQGEWLSTGDSYVQDEQGYYTCLGRSNDLLKAGGIWVSPAEVEARLLEHPQVSEVAVVGAPDAEGLIKPVAAVVPVDRDAVTKEELVAWCREGLASFKRPRAVVFVDELPKTATGKVQRFKIRDLVVESGAAAAAPTSPLPTASTSVPESPGVTA
jgi:benzoate-CoA ligase family protein